MAKVKIGPYRFWPLTLAYVGLVIVLSLLAYYVRLQSYTQLKLDNPDISFSSVVVPALELVPNKFFIFPWTLLTEPFVQTSIFEFVLALPVIFFGVEYLESNWNIRAGGGRQGSVLKTERAFKETAYYLTVVSFLTNISLVLLKSTAVVCGITSPETLARPTNYGFFTIVMSFLVVVKQLSPEYNVRIFKVIKFRLKRLPFIILTLALVLSVAIARSADPFLNPLFVNFYVSWCYLRYYQINQVAEILPTATPGSGSQATQTVRGDASDTFAFIQFFPDSWHQYLKPVSRFFYHSSVFLGLFHPFNDDDIESSNLRTIQRLNKNTTVTSQDETDRRKRVALKVLEQRVGKNTANGANEAASDNSAAAAPSNPVESK
ncbi:DEKNAAC102409 [Brettanomyces naardenensis]|uniref:DEKNAAC102409 n=1 Tax=Brettanomyces naardenensis TaxID=13370 RepID=A0A448YKA8_BRENA|nr:DEKNAAC102409 [Brettanomyces naardenensis]